MINKIIVCCLLVCFALQLQVQAALSSQPSVDASKDAPTYQSVFEQSVKEFKTLTKADRKARISEAKKAIKAYKKAKKSHDGTNTDTLLMVIIAILLPPLAVYLHENDFNGRFWLSLLLTLLFWLPGVIYALYVILSKD